MLGSIYSGPDLSYLNHSDTLPLDWTEMFILKTNFLDHYGKMRAHVWGTPVLMSCGLFWACSVEESTGLGNFIFVVFILYFRSVTKV